MNITLYNCSTEPNRLDKSNYLTSVASYENVAANIELGVEHPTILIQTSTDLSAVNYAYIAEFGRYYHVNALHVPVNDMWRIECTVDVLMTYKTEILALSGVIQRNTNNYDLYLEDPRIPSSIKRNTTLKLFPSTPFTRDNNLSTLIVLGGK